VRERERRGEREREERGGRGKSEEGEGRERRGEREREERGKRVEGGRERGERRERECIESITVHRTTFPQFVYLVATRTNEKHAYNAISSAIVTVLPWS
jgi:hypothetical protein